MKATLLLVLCIVLFLGYSEGRKHGKFGQQRPRKHRLMRPMRNRPYRLRFGKIKQQMFYHFNRIFGGKRRQSNSTAGQAEFNTSSTAGHPFRILQVCKHRCQDDCASVNSCRQTCRGNCENGKLNQHMLIKCSKIKRLQWPERLSIALIQSKRSGINLHNALKHSEISYIPGKS